MITTELVTAPKREPVEIVDLQQHLRLNVEYSAEQPLLQSYIVAARKLVEQISGRVLIQQTLRYYMRSWPQIDYFKLPSPPLISVTSVKYRDSDYTEQTMTASEYRALTNVEPGRVVLDYGESWPSDTLIGNEESIYTEYVAGYGDARTDVPDNFRIAIMQIVGHMYEYREVYLQSPFPLRDVPYAALQLIEPDRVSRFGL